MYKYNLNSKFINMESNMSIINTTCFMTNKAEGCFMMQDVIVKDSDKALLNSIEIQSDIAYKLENGSEYATIESFKYTIKATYDYGWLFFNDDGEEITFEEWLQQHMCELQWQTYVEDESIVIALKNEQNDRNNALKAKQEIEKLRLQAIQSEKDRKSKMIELATSIVNNNRWYPEVWSNLWNVVESIFDGAIICVETPYKEEVTDTYGRSSGDGFADAFTDISETYIKQFQKKTVKLKDGSTIEKNSTFVIDDLNKAEAYIEKLKTNMFYDYHFYKEYNYKYEYAVSVYTLEAWIHENYEDIILYNSQNPNAKEYIPSFYRKVNACNQWAQSIATSLNLEFDEWEFKGDKYQASYKDEIYGNIYFLVSIDDAYNLDFIRGEIDACIDRRKSQLEAETKKQADRLARQQAAKLEAEAKLNDLITKYQPYIDAAIKAGYELIEVKGQLPKVKGYFVLRNYGGKKGCQNPYINYVADDPNCKQYLKVVTKPIIKKKV